MDTPLSFATQLVRQTGQLLLDYFHQRGLHTRLKADHSVVTEADLAADRLVAQSIQDAYPRDSLLSEELQPSLARSIRGAVWVVDPLDGTTNFSLGLHYWGVLITRLVEGWPEETAMYFPLLDELYTAQRGQGAFLNGESIQVEPPDSGRKTSFFTCCSRVHRHYQVDIRYKTRILGCAAYSFCSVGKGIALLGFEDTPKIWDIAGGWLLVREAGGTVETYDGSSPFPLILGKDYTRQSYPTLIAAAPALIRMAREKIQPK